MSNDHQRCVICINLSLLFSLQKIWKSQFAAIWCKVSLERRTREFYICYGNSRLRSPAMRHTPYANMADHSVVAWNELYESEASWASVFCFDNASSEKSCFVRDLVFFISLRLRVFMFLNATRRDRNCPAFASKGKKWIHAIH